MRIVVGTLALALCCLAPALHAQARDPSDPESAGESRWEMSLDGRIGVPTGEVKVDEVGSSGTRLRLHGGLGIDVSEAVGNLAYRLTPRDAIRATLLYYFLDGCTTSREAITYNGPTFPYFFQHEHSHEDDNRFELIDNAVQAGLRFRF
jgi:hypothetical protein